MAKSKKHKSPVKRKKSLSTKSKVMSTKKKRRRSTAVARRTRAIAVPRKRRRKGLSAGSSSLKVNAIHNAAGATGGGVYAMADHLTKAHVKNHWVKFAGGAAIAVGIGMAGMPFAAAGAAGAAGSDLVKSMLTHGFMNDDEEMNDVEYVHPDTLSDSGFEDAHGNMLLMDEEGMCYSPDEEGTYHAVGDMYSLAEATDMDSVSMLPLYDHGSKNPYNLSQGY